MWMIIHPLHTEYPSAPVSFLAQSCRPSLPLLLLCNSCLHTSVLSFIPVCWLWIIFHLLTFYARGLICFDFVRLAQKILCNPGNNLSFSAWPQVTPELCSSFCDAFTLLLSSPRPRTSSPLYPSSIFLQYLLNMLSASHVLIRTILATSLSGRCYSIPTNGWNCLRA